MTSTVAFPFLTDDVPEFPPLSRLGLAALSYSQEYGMPVFPVIPRKKKPLTENGFHDASTHPEKICEWWDRWPNANIGFSPGSMGWVVLDIDNADAEEVARELGLLDTPTLEVVSHRGRHLYFALPKGVTLNNRSPWKNQGIDIRSASGYVLLPPSIHASGHEYAWRGSLE